MDGAVAGTYLHGLFDGTEARSALLRWAGLLEVEEFDYFARQERDIDRLADCVEARLDFSSVGW